MFNHDRMAFLSSQYSRNRASLIERIGVWPEQRDDHLVAWLLRRKLHAVASTDGWRRRSVSAGLRLFRRVAYDSNCQ